MNDFLQQEFLGNTLFDYLATAGIILLALILNKLISRFLASLSGRIAKRIWKTFDERKFTELVVHPMGAFLVATAIIIAFYRLHFPHELNIRLYKYSLQRILLSVMITVQIVFFTWLLLRIIDFIAFVLEKKAALSLDQTDNQLIVFFRDLLKVLIGVVGFLLILHFAFNYNIGNLLTGLSIVGAAIALALRESLENLIASFVIFFDKPFTTGDAVKVQNISGKIEKIGLRSTRIRSEQKTYVSVPNKQMVDSILDNISLRSQQKNELQLHVSPETTSNQIEALIGEIKLFLSEIKELQSFTVLFSDINVQAYTILVEFFLPAAYLSEFNIIKQQLNFFALQTMEKLDIKIAGGKKMKDL